MYVFNREGNPVKVSHSDAVPVEPLGIPTVARQIPVSDVNGNTVLSAECKRITMYVTVDTRYEIGAGAQVADATSHFIAAGERMDLAVPENANIAVIRMGADSGTLELSEIG